MAERMTIEEVCAVLTEIRDSNKRIEANIDLLRGEVRVLQDMRSNHELRIAAIEKKLQEQSNG